MIEPRDNGLTEGLDPAQQTELGDLSRLEARLRTLQVSDPTPEEHAALVTRLTATLAAAEPLPERSLQPALWLQIARAQIRLLGMPFWMASGFILVLGVSLGLVGDGSLLAILFVLCAPVLAAVGVAYVFRPETRSLRELEDISPIGSLELLYVRLGVILAFNILLCLAILAAIALHAPQSVVVWRLLLAWLGPMLALTGTALYASLRLGSPAGVAVPLGLWGLLMFLGWRMAAFQREALPGEWLLAQISHSDLILLGSLVALLAGLVLVQQASQYLRQETAGWH